jgi:phospholipid/cholesterol/gamma-HCH transport system permease protein
MNPLLRPHEVSRDVGRGVFRWFAGWWRIVHLGAMLLVLALSPSSYRGAHRAELARHLYLDTAPLLGWFSVLTALISLVLIRIVLVTAVSYGLTQFALEMLVRVLVLELIPLTAAIFVALRCSLPNGAEIAQMRARGEFDAQEARGADPLRDEVLPRVVSGMFAVLLLAAIASVVALVLTYVMAHGFGLGALEGFTRRVGHVFTPAVTTIFVLKTLFLSLAVALIPIASVLYELPRLRSRTSGELAALVRLFMVILVIEIVSLVGNYY